LLAGRDVSYLDTPQTPRVAVVNRQFARAAFHSEEVIGRYFKLSSGTSYQIVGLVGDGKYLTLSENASPAVFFPISQEPATNTVLIIRTLPGDPNNEIAASIRKSDSGYGPRSADT
jgi:hypothetical protein